ncbi:MAG: hypothetical protein K0U68_07360 [Gammaproteobacteria bacterium]|nr:hypothetical protein [Gammaproteobacteria bacterium]
MPLDYTKAIELAESGEWDAAHKMVQAYSDPMACLIHAYLHRVEGDQGNAGYWYNRAGGSVPDNSLAEELNRLKNLIEADDT